ncbi:AAA family ATPase [Mesorhizobium sp.]|uniref:ATP-dependent nuclease n=2 Tax=unclassified Mesorhizobium TaxID=325217 RepID=UPI0025DE06A5|nr:AAA family ATPase [Mesorhizobium sp.]
MLPPQAGDGDDVPTAGDPVYRVRVRGTDELELVWEIIQPHDQTEHFPVSVRRRIGLVRLAAEDRNDRDLRLVYGSALDRLFADTTLRARITRQVAGLDLNESVGEQSGEKLGELDKRLVAAALPGGLGLGLTTTQGLSIGALIGLLAEKDGTTLPLSSWGAGTRRMAALEIASASRLDGGIVTIDELERGLEPYRLRKLVRSIIGDAGQSFVTTHSPVAIACADDAALWYLDTSCRIGALPRNKIAAQQQRDPETFLARVAVIGEGPTEAGFLRYLLEKAFAADPLDYGVRVCDGQGNDAVLGLLETLAATGLRFAGLVDDEGRAPGRWATLKGNLGDRLLQWQNGCTEQVVIDAIPDGRLADLIRDESGDLPGARLRTLSVRLGIADRELEAIEAAALEKGTTLKALVIAAASGNADEVAEEDKATRKEWKAHGKIWFKSGDGGRELAVKMVALGAWPAIRPRILPLLNAILLAAERPAIGTLGL